MLTLMAVIAALLPDEILVPWYGVAVVLASLGYLRFEIATTLKHR